MNNNHLCFPLPGPRRYFKARGVDPEGMERVRALVPFAFPKTSTRLCNSWAFVSVRVPVWEKTAKEQPDPCLLSLAACIAVSSPTLNADF